MKTPFRLLLDLFRARFFENDAVSPEGGFETNIYQLLGFLATPGILVVMLQMPSFMRLAIQLPGPDVDWVVRIHRLFFPSYSFAVTAFLTVFEWDTIFPDRRDFLILASFPVRLRDLFAAKFAALGLFLLTAVAAVNFFSIPMLPIFSMAVPSVGAAGVVRLVAAQIAATAGASAFAFFAVAAFQGVLINLTSPALFRRLSPLLQMAGMSLAVFSLLFYPFYSTLLRSLAASHSQWLWFFPPFWFSGVYDLFLPHPDPLFALLGRFAITALASAIAIFALAWALGFRRHYRRTLESEDTSSRRPSSTPAERLFRSPEERAIYAFTGRTLARSAKHRLFLATYLSVGFSVGLLASVAIRGGSPGVSRDGLRMFPFVIVFFLISGLRAAFQFPAELSSNWLFRLTEGRWAETSRSATRKQVWIGSILPALLCWLPVEIFNRGWQTGLVHSAFQFASAGLLVEILFWSFRKVPFACSYFAGRMNLAFLGFLYLYGFTTYSFQMADLEKALEGHWGRAMLFFAASGLALMALWRRHPPASDIIFNASSEPYIRTLDLS